MTTPESDQVIQKVSLRFPEIAEEELLALLHVYETAAAIAAVLRSERQPTRYELSRIEVARSNAQQRLSVRLADPGDQEVRGWKLLKARVFSRLKARRIARQLVGCASRNGAIGPSSSVGGAPRLTHPHRVFDRTRSAVVRH